MLIPSIDLMGGRIVQLVQGERLALASDDFEYWIERFRSYPTVQLIDLDAAMGQGENRRLITSIAARLPCQVGGGIRSVERARAVLEAGAQRVIVGSALFADEGHGAGADEGDTNRQVNRRFARSLAQAFGIERLIFSVDSKQGQVAVKGWREQVALIPEEAMRLLAPWCGAFLYTHIDTEGTMRGFPMTMAQRLRSATARRLIVAGGIREQAEIDALDAMGIDAVAGMAVYTGLLAT